MRHKTQKYAGNFLFYLKHIYYNRIYKQVISRRKGIFFEGKVTFIGRPDIEIYNDSRLIVGRNVVLNSSNRGYHVNMHSSVKILADGENAEITIGDNCRIHGTCLHALERITIGRNCLIAANSHIMDSSGHALSFENVENRLNTRGDVRPVVIEDNVWIGMNCIILPGVTIGRGSIIGAGSVVTQNIPPFVLAGGNPAKVIKKYGFEHGFA